MSDILTQDEINALMNGESGGENAPNDNFSGGGTSASSSFSQEALSQLSEVAKLSLGATSSVVQILLNREIAITLDQVRVIDFPELMAEGGGEDFLLTRIGFTEGFDGNSYLMLKKTVSAVIGDLMMGGSGLDVEFQDMHISAVGEMMNQMMGKTTTSLSEIFKKRVDISPPEVEVVNFNSEIPGSMPDFTNTALFLRIGFSLKIGDVVETEMVQLLPTAFAQTMAAELSKPEKDVQKKPKPAPPTSVGAQQPFQPQTPPMGAPIPPQIPGMGMGMGMPGQMPGMGVPMQAQYPGMGMPGMHIPGQTQGSPAEFGMLQMPMGLGLQSNIDLLLDVPLQITVELGRTRMLIKDILELGIGSVVELNKLAGESVEVFVNSKLIAKGEVVVIDENFAVRITSIINPQDRLQAL